MLVLHLRLSRGKINKFRETKKTAFSGYAAAQMDIAESLTRRSAQYKFMR